MAKRKRPQNVVAFPASRIVRKVVASPAVQTRPEGFLSEEREERLDRMAELIAERAKRAISEWQAAEGLPDEIHMLVNRIEEISQVAGGLPAVEVARLYECLPPREEATQGLSSVEIRLLDQLADATRDPNSAVSRALAARQRRNAAVEGMT